MTANVYPNEFIRFLGRPVPTFYHLASVHEGQTPFCCRVYAVRMDDEARRIWAYILRSQWARIHANLQQGHWLAVLLTSGTDNESYQVKGPFEGYRPLVKEDAVLLERQRELTGQTFPYLAPLHSANPIDCVAVGLNVTEIYVQTPGLQAGSLLNERSR